MLLALTKSISFWVLGAVIALFLLQWFEPTGIFLMFFGVAHQNAVLVHVFLGVLFLEAVFHRIPRLFLVVPIVAYGGYYFVYFAQKHLLAEEVAKQAAMSVGKVFSFNPDVDSLVFDDRSPSRAEAFVELYSVPITYSQRISARMAPASECAHIENFHNGALAWVGRIPAYAEKLGEARSPCILVRIERPAGRPVFIREVDHASQLLQWLGINEPSTDVVVDSKLVGSIQKIIVRHIPQVLWALGCELIDDPPSWACFSGIFGVREVIDRGLPPKRWNFRIDPASILLGIPEYTDADIQSFAGYPVNADIVKRAQSPAAPPKNSPGPTKG
jgi:hypothetical protein